MGDGSVCCPLDELGELDLAVRTPVRHEHHEGSGVGLAADVDGCSVEAVSGHDGGEGSDCGVLLAAQAQGGQRCAGDFRLIGGLCCWRVVVGCCRVVRGVAGDDDEHADQRDARGDL